MGAAPRESSLFLDVAHDMSDSSGLHQSFGMIFRGLDSKSDHAGLVPDRRRFRAGGAIFVVLSLDSLQLLMY